MRKGGGHGACASERAIRLRGHLHHLEVAALRLLGALPERRPGVVLRELLLEDGWNGHEVGVLAQLPCTCKKKELIDRSFRVSSCGVCAPWGAGMQIQQKKAQMHNIFRALTKKFFQALWASRLVALRVMPLSLLFSLSWTVSAWRDLVGGGARNEPFEGAPCSAEQFGFGSWMTSILDDGNRLLLPRGCGEIRFSVSTRAALESLKIRTFS